MRSFMTLGKASLGALVGLGLLAAACGDPAPPQTDPAPDPSAAKPASARPDPAALRPVPHGKRSAPVRVDADDLTGASASLTLTFLGAGHDISVHVEGRDGLRVTSDPTPLVRRLVDPRESVSLFVAFQAPETRSHLVVRVEGYFGGRHLATVRAFTVGGAEPERPTEPVKEGGRTLRIVPSREK